MSVIRLLLDEDVRSTLAEALRARGYDAVAVADLEMQGAKDPDLIDWAREERRVILSHNVRDFPSLAASEVPHAGIVVSKQADFKTLLRRILRLLARKQAEDLENRLEWLENYR